MKNFYWLLAFIFMIANPVYILADNLIPVQPIEGEILVGYSCPLYKIKDLDPSLTFPDLGVEVRYNFQIPVSVGATAKIYNINRYPEVPSTYGDGVDYYGGFLFGANGEYDFRRGRKVNPFVSIGAGLAILNNTNDTQDNYLKRGYFQPKVGVELFHHLRINLSVIFTRRDACGFSLSIGGVIGGRPRKK